MKQCDIDLKKGGDTEIRPVVILNTVSTLKLELAMTMGINSRPSPSSSPTNNTGGKMTERVRKITTRIFPLYLRVMIEQNSLNFDDIILKATKLLIVDSKGRDNTRRRWNHVLVDEFQGQLD